MPKHNIPVCLVFLAALLLLNLFNWALPLTDTNEAVYGQVAKEMVETGEYLTPHIFGRPFFDKPPMAYWLIALSYRAFGINDWAPRLPSTLFAALGVALLFCFVDRLFGRRPAWLSALVLLGTLEYSLLARMVLTDQFLFVFLSACLVCFHLGWRAGDRGRWLVRAAYALAGLAVMTKGPIGLALPGLIILSFVITTGNWRRWRDLCLPSGLLIFCAIALPWYFMMWRYHGMDFVRTFLGVHNYLRAIKPQYSGTINEWWYYLALLPIGFFPWFGIVPYALRAAWPRPWSSVKTEGDRYFLLHWAAIVFIVFSIIATKYTTYTLPAFFPLAALAGVSLDDRIGGRQKTSWLSLSAWQIPTIILALAMPAILFLALQNMGLADELPGTVLPFGVLFGLGAAALILGLLRGNWQVTIVTLGMVGLLQGSVILRGLFVPFSEYFSAKKAVTALREAGWRDEPLGYLGSYRWSATYYSGQWVPLVTNSPAPYLSGLSWDVKQVMPRVKPEDFLSHQAFYLLAEPESCKIPPELQARVKPLATVGEVTVYKGGVESTDQ